jgi:hypothetical protein
MFIEFFSSQALTFIDSVGDASSILTIASSPPGANNVAPYLITPTAKALAFAALTPDGFIPVAGACGAEDLVRARGAWLLFLPAYSRYLSPIEMMFSKIKTLLRKRAARSFDATTQALSDICDRFPIAECRIFFKAAGYEGE